MANITELKTLKDLEIHQHYSSKTGYDLMVRSEELKAEAVKWIKNNLRLSYKDKMYPRARIEIRWIKHFFNITEDDLK